MNKKSAIVRFTPEQHSSDGTPIDCPYFYIFDGERRCGKPDDVECPKHCPHFFSVEMQMEMEADDLKLEEQLKGCPPEVLAKLDEPLEDGELPF